VTVTDKGVRIVYRNHDGIVKEYFIIPHEGSMRFDYPWTKADSEAEKIRDGVQKTWIFDATVVRSPDNVERTFAYEKILEWKKA
jgi:hypothetical protein